MSFELAARVHDVPGLNAYERAVLVYLANCHNKITGRCHPKVTTIAEKTGWSVRTVYNALNALKKKGLITILEQGYPGRANLYSLHLTAKTTDAGLHAMQTSPAPYAVKHLHGVHTNKEVESGKETGMKTSSKLQSYEQDNSKEKQTEGKIEIQEKEQASPKYAPPPIALAPLPVCKSDIKVVALWKEELSKIGLTSIVNGQNAKMLSQFVGQVGYSNAVTVIPFIVNQWEGFTNYAKTTAAAYPIPSEPAPAFLSKYSDKAIDYFNDETKKKIEALKQKEAQAVLYATHVSVAKVFNAKQPEPIIEMEKIATAEDVLAIMLKYKQGNLGHDPK